METEIKLRLARAAQAKPLLARLGFRIVRRRVFEVNLVFDTVSGALRRGSMLLRLRQAGQVNTITFKGPPTGGRHKSREEVETEFADFAFMQRILMDLGFLPAFRYEKYRTEFAVAGASGVVMLDETPIGDFLELEGRPRWIDRTARALGFAHSDYITASYGRVYLDYCAEKGIEPANMTFGRRRQRA